MHANCWRKCFGIVQTQPEARHFPSRPFAERLAAFRHLCPIILVASCHFGDISGLPMPNSASSLPPVVAARHDHRVHPSPDRQPILPRVFHEPPETPRRRAASRVKASDVAVTERHTGCDYSHHNRTCHHPRVTHANQQSAIVHHCRRAIYAIYPEHWLFDVHYTRAV